jgi:hypothetical protein
MKKSLRFTTSLIVMFNLMLFKSYAQLPSPPALATSNVSEAAQYGVMYQFNIPNDMNSGAAITYAVNNSGLTGLNYNRVAYFMQLDAKWVWVSMNKFNTTNAQLRIPFAGTGLFFQQQVTGMNVFSSAGSGVTSATGINGNIEMWPNCYSPGLGLGSIGGNSGNYDFNDVADGTDCYGSFQVHNFGAAQTIFAYNSFIGGGNDDLGIGNATSGPHPDWTFTGNAGSYATKVLYICVQQGLFINTQPSTLTVNACATATVAPLTTSVSVNSGSVTGYTWYSNTLNSTTGGTIVATTATSATSNSYTPPTSLVGTRYYYCTITSSTGGTITTTTSGAITVNATPTVAVNSGSICAGKSFTMSASGASTYVYSGGSTVVSPSSTTSYTVTGTTSGCSNTAVATITVNANPIVSVNSGSICNGSSFTITPSGASTYVYTGGSANVSPSTNSSYTVTGTSALGCTNTAVSSVTVNANPTVAVNSGSICNGSSFTMLPSGASTYAYTGGSASVSPSSNASYTVTGTNAAGCTNTAVSTVTVNAVPTVAVNSGSICAGKSFTMTPTGASTYVYTGGSAIVSPSSNASYTVTGTSVAGCSNSSVATVTVNANPTVAVNSGAICNGSSFTMIPSGASSYAYTGGSAIVNPSSTTSYTVTGTNALGCTSTAVSIVTVNANPTVAVNSGAICNGSSFTMNPSGALTYVYSSGAALVSPTTTTTYSVTGTNAAGCSNTALSTVTVNAIPTIVIPSVGVCTGGTATLTPSGAASYTYSGGSAIVTPASNTTYTITGTSAAGCIGSAVTTVSVSGSLIFAVNSGSICTGKSFTMTPSGAATYTYSSGSPVVSPTSNTTYTVTGASAAGCLGTAIASVTVNVNPSVSVNSGTICSGESFTISPTGAATYVYTGGSATVSPTANTNYTVTGTSALGCTNTAVSNVVVNANPVLTVNSGSLCSGNNFTFAPTGAISYTYSSGSAIVTPTATTDYTVTGSNAFGCTSSSVKTITVSITPIINVSSGAVCTGGSWTITPTGAATYTYSSGSAVVTPTAATTDYTVSGSNIDGCQSLAVITITVNPTLLFSPNSGSVCIGSTFTMSPTGAASYTYSSGSALVTPTTTTTYTIIAVNSVGCLGEDYCTVTVNALPTLTVNSGAICAGQSFTIVPTGASTYTYSSGSDVVNPLATTDYSVTGTDANGCVTATDAISTVTVNALPTVTAATDFTLICVGEVATLSAGGASTYVWNTSATTATTSVTPTTTTTYSVDGTDGNGCVNTANVTVNVNDCVGIQQLSSAKLNVNVYPNPTTGLITLDLNATTQVTITNALGQVILTETVVAGKQTINLKNQHNGLYFMTLNQDGKQQTIKVIKN